MESWKTNTIISDELGTDIGIIINGKRQTKPVLKYVDQHFLPGSNNKYCKGRKIDPWDREYHLYNLDNDDEDNSFDMKYETETGSDCDSETHLKSNSNNTDITDYTTDEYTDYSGESDTNED